MQLTLVQLQQIPVCMYTYLSACCAYLSTQIRNESVLMTGVSLETEMPWHVSRIKLAFEDCLVTE